ncbi:MAG: hypothetical protein WCK21_03745, partial [Actinomycetota bacterium]
MATKRVRRAAALAVVLGLVMAACDHGKNTSSSTANGIDGSAAGAPRLFGLHLSEGTPQTAVPAGTKVVKGDTVSAERVREILARLPEFLGGSSLQQPFNWPTQTTPPPRAGTTVAGVFPPAQKVPTETVPTGPLHVLRHQPDGVVPIAPYLSITFDQPMVPVTTLGQLDAVEAPVKLSPAVAGHWQWIGTRTLRFDATSDLVDRLPMATTFAVEVPKGTKSATGGILADAVTFTFTTPPPTVRSFTPEGESLPLQQVFVATFDQRIDPAAVLRSVHL